MKTVYVVTTAPGARARAVRQLVGTVAARILFLLAWFGHIVVLAGGALDALLTALLGVPRLSFVGRRFTQMARETWEADL